MKNWIRRLTVAATTLALTAPVVLASDSRVWVNPNDFKVDRDMSTPIATYLAKLLANVLFLVFEVAVIIAIGYFIWGLIQMMVMKKSRDQVFKEATDKLIAIFIVVVLLSGGGSLVLHILTDTATRAVDSATQAISDELNTGN